MTFNVNTVSLQGRHLVEASAGTGKTYSIANLFLRLLLQPHPSNNHELPLAVEQILVVTFTNAATDELCGRIRKKVEEALTAFSGGESRDDFINDYKQALQDAGQLEQACGYLYNALLCIDEAAIFTIHSFAARAIQSFLFETGALAEVELVIGANPTAEKIKADLLRLSLLHQDGFWPALGDIKARQNLIKLLKLTEIAIVPRIEFECDATGMPLLEETANTLFASLKQQQELLAREWAGLTAGLDEKAVNAAIRPVIDNSAGNSQAGAFIKKLNEVFTDAGLFFKPLAEVNSKRLARVGQEHILTDNPWYDFVLKFKDWYLQALALPDLLKAMLHQYFVLAMLKTDINRLAPEDVIRLLNNTLKNPSTKAALQQVVTDTYPVCMVDEFQDTDPEQFRLFDKLYENVEQHTLFAIGDPKQSIYGFRGADIFAYLDVKNAIAADRVHTLDTNYRSKLELMTAVNALFHEATNEVAKNETETAAVFYYPGIRYEPIYSCEAPESGEKQDKGQLLIAGKANTEALVFIGHEVEEDCESFNDLLGNYAEDAAERIVGLLNNASISRDDVVVPLDARDIAVLVRDIKEATAMKMALSARNIQAVYLSQKDSVFKQCIFAQDLLLVLQAMDEPNSKSRLKAAFATPLLRHFTSACDNLDAIENDDNAMERYIAEFSHYQQLWDKKGMLSVLNELLIGRDIVNTFAGHADRDRLMTDFRHLGELLQQQYLQSGSRERLIDWYHHQLQDDSELDEDSKSLRLESDANLVKIVTLHGCKGLEYPVVFMPFFFSFKGADLKKNLPVYHQSVTHADGSAGWQAIVDFASDNKLVEQQMNAELMAENMRLFYVGVTRAIYQCYIGVSAAKYNKKAVFPNTVWQQLTGITEEAPKWSVIKSALQKRMQDTACGFTTTQIDSTPYVPKSQNTETLVQAVPVAVMPESAWLITSYSALAHNKTVTSVHAGKDDEIFAPPVEEVIEVIHEDDSVWQNDIRFSLRGSANTGECLHRVFEELVLEKQSLAKVVEQQLRVFGLAKPEGVIAEQDLPAAIEQRKQAITTWLQQTLDTPLHDDVPALQNLFAAQSVLPEMAFDFVIGSRDQEVPVSTINTVLQQAGVAAIARNDYRKTLHGIMTGSIDLLFVHDKKVYVLDYKSNTLGKAPRFYDQPGMDNCMQANRYDLQYLIYSVAAHRYMQQRLAGRYHFDEGEYSFGGVFYLFLRGMGVDAYPGNGIWFKRPARNLVETLDKAFTGKTTGVEL